MIRGYFSGEPRFLSVDEVLTLHETAIDVFGGMYGVRDNGLLESALAMPRQSFGGEFAHSYPFGMAAGYLFHLCTNHSFLDGNKRVAFSATIAFLRMNGWNLVASEDDAFLLVTEVAQSKKSKEDVELWLRENVKARSSLELRDFFQRLNYPTLESVFRGIAVGPIPERVATILEAGQAIPAITEANVGAADAEGAGDEESAHILRHHSMLLTAIYRIAEDMGYEW